MKEIISIFSIARKSRWIIVVMMIGLVISQPAWSIQDKEVAVEIADDTQQDEVFVLESPTVAPSSHANLHHAFYEILVIEYDSGSETKEYHEITGTESFRRVLFRRVISPNAP